MQGRIAAFLDLKGRAGRGEFWATVLLVSFVALFPMTGLTLGLALPPMTQLGLVTIVSLLFSLATAPVYVRRLHDRGRSAWWLTAFLAAPWLLTNLAATPAADGEVWADVLHLTGLLLALWGLAELGVRRGQPGANRYGDPPTRPAIA